MTKIANQIIESIKNALETENRIFVVNTKKQRGNQVTELNMPHRVYNYSEDAVQEGVLAFTVTETKRGVVTQIELDAITDGERDNMFVTHPGMTVGRITAAKSLEDMQANLIAELEDFLNDPTCVEDMNRNRILRLTNTLKRAWKAEAKEKSERAEIYAKVSEYVKTITGRDKLNIIACRTPKDTEYMYRAEPATAMANASVERILTNMTENLGRKPKREETEYGEAYIFNLGRKRQVRFSVNVRGARKNVRGITVRQYA